MVALGEVGRTGLSASSADLLTTTRGRSGALAAEGLAGREGGDTNEGLGLGVADGLAVF